MEKKEIISILQDARISHSHWLNQGKIILDGINLDRIEEPVDHTDCGFVHWCESNKEKMLSFSGFKELQQLHDEFHQTYSHLFYDSMRKYNPSTMNQLIERYESLKSKSIEFNNILDDIEGELFRLSDESFNDLSTKSISDFEDQKVLESLEQNVKGITDKEANAPTEINDSESSFTNKEAEGSLDIVVENADFKDKDTNSIDENQKDNSSDESTVMQNIDIKKYDINQNPFDELESVIPMKERPQNNLAKLTKRDEMLENNMPTAINKIAQCKVNNADISLELVPSANRLISLKEQSIIQLNQEKELSKLELVHIESTQNLTQKSIEQLKQYYSLKQQEIEEEEKNNTGFLDFKSNEKIQIEDELSDIKDKKSMLENDIKDLEKKNVEDEIKLDENSKEGRIEKQFQELKNNKNNSLNELKDYKKERENDLVNLKEQVLLLEKEISGISNNIDQKHTALLDLEEKESLKKEERSLQQLEQVKIKEKRNDTIINMQKDFDLLSSNEQIKQIELDTIIFQLEELNKSNSIVVVSNSDELKELELQQEYKREKLLETEKLKASKQTEITDIELHIVAIEGSIAKLKLAQTEAEEDQTSEELI